MYAFLKAPAGQQPLAPHGHRGHPNPCGCGGAAASPNVAPTNGGFAPGPGKTFFPLAQMQQQQAVGAPTVFASPQQGNQGICPPGQALAAAPAQAVVQQSFSAPVCVPTDVGTIPCGVPLAQAGSSVQAQACVVAPRCPPMTFCITDCRSLLLVFCSTRRIFIVEQETGGVLIFNPVTCDFATTPLTGCVMDDVSPVVAVCDFSQNQAPGSPPTFIFVACLPTGEVLRWNGASRAFATDACFPIASCTDIRCVVVDNSGALPQFFVHERPTAESLSIDVTTQFCPPTL